MPRPVIVVDDAIAHSEAALGPLGELHRAPAAELPSLLGRVRPDALIVRSVTQINAALLDRAPSVRFVGTATAGTDHLDLAELAAREITTASAAGCNAQAVAEWVVTALELAQPRLSPQLLAGPIGVVGFGNVGSRVAKLLRALGREVVVSDPPLARAGGCAEPLVEFEALWRRCSIVSFHVPLIEDGHDQTWGYVDAHTPAPAGPKLIINTSRGAVVRDAALDRADIHAAILDVWDHEPHLNVARLHDPKLLFASPHVAGYSLEGKIAATRMMHEAVCAWLGRTPSWTGAELLPIRPLDPTLTSIARTLAAVVDLEGDDARTRALARLPSSERAAAFEALRRHYVLRREFRAWAVAAEHPQREWLLRAGFSRSGLV
ncbi:MAG TPA: 4-phosphoerythronate dehydrogenase [Enhygromyxa sp.]|nr:4-phosphoerythronate dehydrogenase [Enhygromyxa sp.]